MSFWHSILENQFHLLSTLTYMVNTMVSIFIMVDPLAAIPIYLVLTERLSPSEVRKTRQKATFVATAILVLFAIAGVGVLNFFGISISALRISGGILLLKVSLEHLGGGSHKKEGIEEDTDKVQRTDLSVVPLAMPLLAGPGAISTIIVQSTVYPTFFGISTLIFSIIVVMIVTYYSLKSSQYLFRLFGKTGLNLLGRIMGILVAAIAIEFIIKGVKDTLPHL